MFVSNVSIHRCRLDLGCGNQNAPYRAAAVLIAVYFIQGCAFFQTISEQEQSQDTCSCRAAYARCRAIPTGASTCFDAKGRCEDECKPNATTKVGSVPTSLCLGEADTV